MSFPYGWRTAVTSDGRMYYQNEITKQTQWHPPVTVHQPSQIHMTYDAPHSVIPNAYTTPISTQRVPNIAETTVQSNAATDDEIVKRPLYHKEHIIWFITFALGIYDYITDIQVVQTWTLNNFSGYCQKFNCVTFKNVPFQFAATCLLIFSSIGFIVATCIKAFELKSLYLMYKYPVTEADVNVKEQKIWKTTLKWGWIPLIFEDAVSVILITFMYLLTLQVKDLGIIYFRSVCMAIIGVIFNLLNSYRKKLKLKKLNVFEEARRCHSVWCICMCCTFIPYFVMILSYGAFAEIALGGSAAFVKLLYTENITIGSCGYYYTYNITEAGSDTVTAPEDRVFMGDIIYAPQFIYGNCSGEHYEYEVICAQHKDTAKTMLQCDLNWNYLYNQSNGTFDCNAFDDEYCAFDIHLGVCENYAIECANNFEFYDGNPVMWACFDYCRA